MSIRRFPTFSSSANTSRTTEAGIIIPTGGSGDGGCRGLLNRRAGSRPLPRRVPGLSTQYVRTLDRVPLRIPETEEVPPRGEQPLVPPHPHRKARTNQAARFRSFRPATVFHAKTKQRSSRCRRTAISRSRRVSTASRQKQKLRTFSRAKTTRYQLRPERTASRVKTTVDPLGLNAPSFPVKRTVNPVVSQFLRLETRSS